MNSSLQNEELHNIARLRAINEQSELVHKDEINKDTLFQSKTIP